MFSRYGGRWKSFPSVYSLMDENLSSEEFAALTRLGTLPLKVPLSPPTLERLMALGLIREILGSVMLTDKGWNRIGKPS